MKGKRILVASLLCLLVAGAVFAQSNTVVTIGGNYWRGVMKMDAGTGDSENSKAGNLFGPYISVRFDKLSLGGSWFFGNWDFSQENYTAKLKRSDLNLSLGYSLNSNLSIFGAYKILKLTTEIGSDLLDIKTRDNTVWNMPYVGGGLSLTYPFPNSPLFLFGSGAYLVNAKKEMEVTGYDEWTGDEYTFKQEVKDKITTFTVGLGYRLESGISVLAGYRGDIHSSGDDSDNSDDSGNLKINGLIVTLAYTLR
jgi:predicted porin